MFDLPDELFISQVYWRLLGRPADPAGYVNYVNLLRNGASRVQLLGEFQSSQEAMDHQLRPQSAQTPTAEVGLWPRDLAPQRAGWRRFKRLRRVKESQLLAISGPLFVDAACWVLLGRPPTEQQRLAGAGAAETQSGRRELLQALKKHAPFHRRLWPRATQTRLPLPDALPARKLNLASVHDAAHFLRPLAGPALQTASRSAIGTGAFTIATRSYLPFVRVLMRSLRAAHQDLHLFVLLVEESVEETDQGPWVTISTRDLDLANFDDMSVRYDVVELSTSLKPFCFRWLLERTQLRRLIYMDPDIRVYAPLLAVEKALNDGAAMVFTPHLDIPLPANGQPDTLTILKSGIFNLGFVALQRCEESLRFLDWWGEQLQTSALVSFEQNMFTDQRWCDLAVAFVPTLEVLRDRGCNVAYWNLPHRSFSRSNLNDWCVAGTPLIFFHFSGFDPDVPESLSKYQTRPILEQMPALQSLLTDYADELHANGWRELHELPYAYGNINGVALSRTVRSLFRKLHPKSSGLSREEALEVLLQQCRPEGAARASERPWLTPLMRHLHDSRPDLRSTFDIHTQKGRQAYSGWFWSAGIVEHGLTSLLRLARSLEPNGASPQGVSA